MRTGNRCFYAGASGVCGAGKSTSSIAVSTTDGAGAVSSSASTPAPALDVCFGGTSIVAEICSPDCAAAAGGAASSPTSEATERSSTSAS
mmetsp:Transcript_27422/g.69158  ORF Transcript_27422/g.69158 Transcript_27422/m.69158 type:complete len:90 (-) Transcript_27422:962-1231(-)